METNSSEGMISLASPWPVNETADRIEAALSARKIKLFARLDQSAEAAAVGLKLRPTILLIFGDPAKGTPLMESYPALAIDLPLKALIWEAKPGEAYLSLNSPEFFRNGINSLSRPFPKWSGFLPPC